MNRQFRRRVEREWNKIEMDRSCTKFVESNVLFTIPYVIEFQAVKISDDMMCVYSVSVFGFKDGLGFLERITVCQFISSLFRGLGSLELGFVPEEDLENGEEI